MYSYKTGLFASADKERGHSMEIISE